MYTNMTNERSRHMHLEYREQISQIVNPTPLETRKKMAKNPETATNSVTKTSRRTRRTKGGTSPRTGASPRKTTRTSLVNVTLARTARIATAARYRPGGWNGWDGMGWDE